MTREDRAQHLATLKSWYRLIRKTSCRSLWAELASWAGRRGWLALRMAEADTRLERRTRVA